MTFKINEMKTKINIDFKKIRNYTIILMAGLLFGWLFFHNSGETTEASNDLTEHAEDATIWTCSMHPQIRMDKPGKCPICSMDLIPLVTISSEDNVNPDGVQMSESAMKLAEIQTMVVKKDLPNKKIFLLGKVKADERNISELTARFGGRIEKLFVNFTGQNVRKGEKLATIYSPELVTAQKELLEAMEYKQSNPTLYEAARNKLKLWDLSESQIDGIEEKGQPQNYFDVLSPVSGTVTIRNIALGDYVKEGNALFQVTDLTRVWVMFEAYESDLPWLKTGDEVEFTVQSVPGKKFSGKVTYIDPFLDPKTRVAYVRVEISNPEQVLKPEMFANGVITPEISGEQKELLIPKTSVLWTGKRAVVYVKSPDSENASFLYREIVLGPEAGDSYIVKEGLAEGEEIAVNGVFRIDAAAQLEGKPSMMNPGGGAGSMGSMPGMDMGGSSSTGNSGHTEMDMNANDENSINNMDAMEMNNNKNVSFFVDGLCDMCKDRIETAALSVPGVSSAVWDIESKTAQVTFDMKMTDMDKIQKAIAAVGHDTEKYRADDDVYNALPECCLYRK